MNKTKTKTIKKDTVGIVVFSRYSSTRLPGKALKEIAGRSLLGRVLDRVRQCETAHKVIVATSFEPWDDALAAVVEDERGVDLFRGPLDDVAGRALGCMRAFDLDVCVRICGDSPFIDPKLITQIIDLQATTGADLATNVFTRSYPAGQSVEAMTRAAFERAYPRMTKPGHFEHVTQFFYEHPADFSIENMSSPGEDLVHLNLCVDTRDDFLRAKWIAHRLGCEENSYGMQTLIEATKAWYALHPQDRVKAV